jgi:hypothetical protein
MEGNEVKRTSHSLRDVVRMIFHTFLYSGLLIVLTAGNLFADLVSENHYPINTYIPSGHWIAVEIGASAACTSITGYSIEVSQDIATISAFNPQDNGGSNLVSVPYIAPVWVVVWSNGFPVLPVHGGEGCSVQPGQTLTFVESSGQCLPQCPY